MPTFSVITVNFNSGDKLLHTIPSVLTQEQSVEYIIVDGASTDQSIEIARRAARENAPLIRVISEPDRGIYDAMNKGIAAATGKYIYFLGAGDFLLPGVLKQIGKALPPHDLCILYGDVMWSGKSYDGEFSRRKLCEKNICHQAIFYGREVFGQCGLYDLRYRLWADWEFNLRVFGNGRIPKQYIPILVSEFEEGGKSLQIDETFEKDKLDLIRRNLGWWHHWSVTWPARKAEWRCRLGRLRRRWVGGHAR